MCLVLPTTVDPTPAGSAAARPSAGVGSGAAGAEPAERLPKHPYFALFWAGWFTPWAVIALIVSELIGDHHAARFAIFAGWTLASIWLRIAVRHLAHRVRSWWPRARDGDNKNAQTDA